MEGRDARIEQRYLICVRAVIQSNTQYIWAGSARDHGPLEHWEEVSSAGERARGAGHRVAGMILGTIFELIMLRWAPNSMV